MLRSRPSFLARAPLSLGAAAGLLLALALPAGAQSWTKLQTNGAGPSGRSTPAVVGLGDSVYVFGGSFDSFTTTFWTSLDDLYRLDTTTNTWEQLVPTGATPPGRVFSASAPAPDRGEMLVFGGTSAFSATFFLALGDFWAYSPADNSWTEIVAGNQGPEPRSRPTMWVDGDKVYLFGGINQFFQFKSDLWEYDFNTNLWTLLSADGAPGAPPGRHEAMAGRAPKQGKLTFYGGETLDFSTFQFLILEDVWSYNIASGTWTDVTPAPNKDLPLHRNYAAAARIGQQLYVFGGDIPGGTSGCGAPFDQNVSDEIWAYHLVQKRWRQKFPSGDLPPALKRANTAVVNDKMYVISGWEFDCPGGVGPGQVFNLDVWVYDNDG